MELRNGEESSAISDDYTASNAIDGDWGTQSITAQATGTHWLQVSMSNILVYQIKLQAVTRNNEGITVSLYSGETLVGQCESHTVSGGTETLSCDRVTADRVRLTMSGTNTYLAVYEIEVTQLFTITIGMYILSGISQNSKY